MKAYRHGELLFVEAKKPNGLKKSLSNTLAVGSGGHAHTFDNGVFYKHKEGDFVIGYLSAKDTSLIHPEHSPNVGDAKLPNGIYQVIKQNEFTPEGLKPVID